MKTSIYLPDDLAADIKRYEISISAVAQRALREEVERMKLAEEAPREEIVALLLDSNWDGDLATAFRERRLRHRDGRPFTSAEWALALDARAADVFEVARRLDEAAGRP